MRRLILAHDLGTSGNKACLFDVDGKLLDSAYETYETYYPQAGYAEQDPNDWWEAVKKSTKGVLEKQKILPEEVVAISFSAQSLGCVPIDQDGNCLRDKTLIWMDGRAVEESQSIIKSFGNRRHYETTGNSFDLSLYPCSKIVWLMKHEPELYADTYKFIGTKEYIIGKLTGVVGITDYSEAGMSGLFNLREHHYESELLAITNIDQEKLCEPVKNTTIVGPVLETVAEELGLSAETKVVLGTLDNLACAIGAGCMNQGTFVTTLGTAGWIGVNHSEPIMSDDFKANVMYVGDDVYHTSMHSHSACVTYDWVVSNMVSNKSGQFEELESMAKGIEPGAEGLFFMPSFLSGNTIYSSPYLAGAFLGLRLHHTQSHLVRAALEGVGFDLMMGMEFFESMGNRPSEVRLIGGGAKNNLWRQILADMFDATMTLPNNMQHIGAMGAAMIAGVGVGVIKDFSRIDGIINPSDPMEPKKEETEIYRNLLPAYKACYEQLMPVYDLQNQK